MKHQCFLPPGGDFNLPYVLREKGMARSTSLLSIKKSARVEETIQYLNSEKSSPNNPCDSLKNNVRVGNLPHTVFPSTPFTMREVLHTIYRDTSELVSLFIDINSRHGDPQLAQLHSRTGIEYEDFKQ